MRGTSGVKPEEVSGNSRSVMPLDVLGRTRATMRSAMSFVICVACECDTSCLERGGQSGNAFRAGDRVLELLLLNEECLVGTRHQRVPNMSLPFVHTARSVVVLVVACGVGG